jgi:hypothetical protein
MYFAKLSMMQMPWALLPVYVHALNKKAAQNRTYCPSYPKTFIYPGRRSMSETASI